MTENRSIRRNNSQFQRFPVLILSGSSGEGGKKSYLSATERKMAEFDEIWKMVPHASWKQVRYFKALYKRIDLI